MDMSEGRWRCDCTAASGAGCTSTDDFHDRTESGGCGCPCHSEYADDPENWQPLSLSPEFTRHELHDMDDWLERMDAAEALIEEAT